MDNTNILKITGIGEVAIGTIHNVYDYCSMIPTFTYSHYYNVIADYAHFQLLETLWKEPELSLKNLLIK